jgi:hypothetical protein
VADIMPEPPRELVSTLTKMSDAAATVYPRQEDDQ